jgi:hypothetical protein
VTAISAGQSVRIVALVTHPVALSQLVGGRLTDATGAINYGAFIADGQGSSSLDVSWDHLNQVAAITFAASEARMLVGEFYDQAGHKTSSSITLQLTCNGESACSGQCVDLTSDANNFGSCGHKVPSNEYCKAGTPNDGRSACTGPPVDGVFNCASYCTSQGLQCSSRCGSGTAYIRGFGSSNDCIAQVEATEFSGPCTTEWAQGTFRCCCLP